MSKIIVIPVSPRDIEALDTAIKLLMEKDSEDKKGMYVCPNKTTDAISRLRLLRHNIEKELKE
jgi:hypothetical protein